MLSGAHQLRALGALARLGEHLSSAERGDLATLLDLSSRTPITLDINATAAGYTPDRVGVVGVESRRSLCRRMGMVSSGGVPSTGTLAARLKRWTQLSLIDDCGAFIIVRACGLVRLDPHRRPGESIEDGGVWRSTASPCPERSSDDRSSDDRPTSYKGIFEEEESARGARAVDTAKVDPATPAETALLACMTESSMTPRARAELATLVEAHGEAKVVETITSGGSHGLGCAEARSPLAYLRALLAPQAAAVRRQPQAGSGRRRQSRREPGPWQQHIIEREQRRRDALRVGENTWSATEPAAQPTAAAGADSMQTAFAAEAARLSALEATTGQTYAESVGLSDRLGATTLTVAGGRRHLPTMTEDVRRRVGPKLGDLAQAVGLQMNGRRARRGRR